MNACCGTSSAISGLWRSIRLWAFGTWFLGALYAPAWSSSGKTLPIPSAGVGLCVAVTLLKCYSVHDQPTPFSLRRCSLESWVWQSDAPLTTDNLAKRRFGRLASQHCFLLSAWPCRKPKSWASPNVHRSQLQRHRPELNFILRPIGEGIWCTWAPVLPSFLEF
jgi:hypothetical protein